MKNTLMAFSRSLHLPVFLLTCVLSIPFAPPPAAAGYIPGRGWAYTILPLPSPKDPGIPATFYEDVGVGCVDAFTAAPLDCPFTISLEVNAIFMGGHIHTRMVGTGIGSLDFVPSVQSSLLTVQGQTLQTPPIYFNHPEMSGGVLVKATILPPPGRVCMPDGSLAACTTVYYLDFQVQGLAPLSLSANGSYVLTGARPSHPGNHFGTDRLNAAITAVADLYFKRAGRQLSVNDMSLPYGGLYDYNDTGFAPHKSHRRGTSVDIDSITVTDPDPQIEGRLRDKLTKLFINNGCTKVEEGPIHYECK